MAVKKALGINGANVEIDELQWLWEGRLPLKLILLTGMPGIGKTFLAMDIVRRVVDGLDWPDGAKNYAIEGHGVVIVSEDNESDTLVPRLKALGTTEAGLSRVSFLTDIIDTTPKLHSKGTSAFTLPEHMPQLYQEIITMKAALVILDPIMAFCSVSSKQKLAEQVILPLARLADTTSTAILMINHTNKGKYNEQNLRAAVGGAAPLQDNSRVNMLIAPDTEKAGIANLYTYKMNSAKTPEMFSYAIEEKELDTGETVPYVNYDFHQVTQHSGQNLRMRILEVLASHGPLQPMDIAKELEENAASIRGTLRTMLCESPCLLDVDSNRNYSIRK